MWSSTVAGVRDVARRDVPLVGSSPGCLVRDSKIPEPPAGHRWKEGEKDWQKYEETRHLKGVVDKIHTQYRADWKSPEMKKRQWAVALYFIDKCPLVQLALQTGNEKEEGEMADTVGCHLLRVEHIWLHIRADGREHVVELDFLGKDSISYHNRVTVEKLTSSLNKHLQDLMDRLTAKVFQTYNASITLQEQLQVLTSAEDSLTSKVLAYNRTNRAVAVLCNHQRATPKTFEKSMQRLQTKIETKKTQVSKVQVELEKGKADLRMGGDSKSKRFLQKQRQMLKLEEQLARLHTQATGREENRRVALGTAKLNYLDPRISIAWKWFSNIWPLEGPRSVTLCGRGSLEAGLSGRPCVLQTKEAKEEAS